MNWYQSLSWLEILFGAFFIFLYGGYIYRVKKAATYFRQSGNAIWFKFALRSGYFFLILIAILGPSFGAMKKEIKTIGKDIFILVDLSASMNVRDIPPSRLERVKYELSRIVPEFDADRIGLIIFTTEAVVQCPLTFDQEALLLYVRLLQTNQAPASGTNYQPALALALRKLTEGSSAQTPGQKSKLILLLSDGENFGEDVRTTLQQLKNNAITVFTVGIGTEAGGFIPAGRLFKRDAQGQKIVSRLTPDPLQEIATKTNGQYFEISDRQNESGQVIRAVNLIEGELRESRTIDITANKYMYPLFLALLLIVSDILITINVIKI